MMQKFQKFLKISLRDILRQFSMGINYKHNEVGFLRFLYILLLFKTNYRWAKSMQQLHHSCAPFYFLQFLTSNRSYTLNNGPNNKIFFGKCPLAFCLSLGKVRIVISLLGNELKIIEKNPLFKKGIPFLKRGYTSAC